MVSANSSVGPLPTPVPVPPEGSTDWLTEEQWNTFMSLIEAVLPPIVTESTITDRRNEKEIPQEQYDNAVKKVLGAIKNPPSLEKFQEFLKDKPSKIPGFIAAVKGGLSPAPQDAKNQLKGVLELLNTQEGSLALTGYGTLVKDQPLDVREAILQNWGKAPVVDLKMLAKTIVLLALNAWVVADPLFAELSGYTDFPKDYTPGSNFDYEFMKFEDGSDPEELETDVVIVGSGCGGSVCAKVLAEAGHRVVVVDKGYYFPPSQLPMTVATGPYHLYENNGVVQTDNNSAIVLAGSCWGGGGTVNWSVGLQTQQYVREEWANEGLSFFTTPKFQESLDRVCEFMGVSTDHVRHTPGAQAILDGAKGLGWESSTVPQNTGGKEHYCGHCHYGCGSNVKQGPATSWLPHAAGNGAKFIEGYHVDKVLLDKLASGRVAATGITGTWTSRDPDGGVSGPMEGRRKRGLKIKAKKVIVSSGSLNTPLLLLRSGLTNPNIGKNLHIHPCNLVSAYYKEEAKCWEGGIITSLCSTFENMDGKGHGVKLETTCGLPSVSVALQPWQDGLTTKLNAVRFRHMSVYITLTRDRDTGRVYPDPISGKPRIDYSPSEFDAGNSLKGIAALAKILYVAGAVEIHPCLPGVEPFVRTDDAPPVVQDGEINDPAFAEWLKHVESVGNTPPVPNYGSAHQMGTCRMSSSEDTGVVNARGQVWGADNLFIADASVFPSASGVNPMVTNMAIADSIAQAVSSELVR